MPTIADESKTVALDDLAREPARRRPDDQPNYESLNCHGRPSAMRRNKSGDSQILAGEL
jgi:hypothetical protein